jgi:Lon protease-like protein
MDQTITLPAEVPVMPIPGAVLFPHALLPLHIFEPRYQRMLDHALHQNRMFCLTLINPQRSQWRAVEDFFHVASVGLIRACVAREDGTSNLILQGLQRVRFTCFSQDAPFPVARITPLDSVASSGVKAEALGAKVLELYERFKESGRQLPDKVDRYLSDLSDPEMLADLMAATFINDPLRRQEVLEELSVTERLRRVIKYVGEELIP